ncbi:glycoside hydrolase [Coprinellus micaceus]|uniref:beta-glucosidase n=1 Tax=Coprinellus micaceus TaxID=71717 RepID=A0A4Y7T414_COPMI|nr:glycoside hydrolase [Coprinellus micaceus]
MPPSDFKSANINEIVGKLTTEEAINLIAGVGFWHTHNARSDQHQVSDGPNGIRGNHTFMGTPAKCLPSATALGATFDPELVKTVGLKLIAEEAKLRAASIVLAPTCNIQRVSDSALASKASPEDPFLSGMIAAAYVNGVQSGGIGSTIKHFVANDKENERFGYDSIVSPRALREIYLMPFMLAQKKEWKFDGMVMSDWFGTMPGTNKWRTLELTVRTIKERAKNVLNLVQKCAQGAPEILDGDGEERTLESEEDKELMRKVAAESISLKKVAIVGGNAKAFVVSGGGSASLKTSYFVSPFQGISDVLAGDNVEVTYAEGARTFMNLPTLENELHTADGRKGWIGTGGSLRVKGFLKVEKDTKFDSTVDGNLRRGESFFGSGTVEETGVYDLIRGKEHEVYLEYLNVRGPADGDEDEQLMDSLPGIRLGGAPLMAVALAKDADVVIAVVQANPKTVVVTQSGSAITLPWIDEVPALVHAWYLGNPTGASIADVLFGRHNPSGKLSLTFPKREEDVPSFGHFHTEAGRIRYAEDLYVGYKHYQHRNIKPLFAFGHGLSYTTFSLSNLNISKPTVAEGELSATATVTVKNTGNVVGSQVVQLYVTLPKTSLLTHPELQLKAFGKIKDLAPGQEQDVILKLDKYAVSYWGETLDTWVVERGSYGVSVGFASDDIVLRGTFEVEKGFEWNGL